MISNSRLREEKGGGKYQKGGKIREKKKNRLQVQRVAKERGK